MVAARVYMKPAEANLDNRQAGTYWLISFGKNR